MALTVDQCRYNKAEISLVASNYSTMFTELFTKVKGKLMCLVNLLVLKRVLLRKIVQKELAFHQFLWL